MPMKENPSVQPFIFMFIFLSKLLSMYHLNEDKSLKHDCIYMTMQAESGMDQAVLILNIFVSSAVHYSYFITCVQVEMLIRKCPIFVLQNT